jgi:hypothetical protein
MFQFTRLPPQALCIQTWVPAHDRWWVSPFGHPRIKGCLAPPRGFSQPTASFVGSYRQGIHRTLLVAWYRCSCSLWSFQGPSHSVRNRAFLTNDFWGKKNPPVTFTGGVTCGQQTMSPLGTNPLGSHSHGELHSSSDKAGLFYGRPESQSNRPLITPHPKASLTLQHSTGSCVPGSGTGQESGHPVRDAHFDQ